MYRMAVEENIKGIFYADMREKKSTGRGYYGKKNGSKSKKCSLPSDGMTERGWRKMNGPVTVTNLSAPMAWEQFKSLRPDLKEEYLRNLTTRFGVTKAALAEVFNVNISTFMKHTQAVNMGDMFHVGKKMSKKQREDFLTFFGIESVKKEEIKESNVAERAPESSVEEFTSEIESSTPQTCAVADTGAKGAMLAMRGVSIEFAGAFDVDHIANSIRYIIPAGTNVAIKIVCEVI